MRRSLARIGRRAGRRTTTGCRQFGAGVDDQREVAPKVVVALSGGVDSAVATGLLLQQEEDTAFSSSPPCVEAIHMTNWNAQDDDSITSCVEQDWRDALQVADHYQIPVTRQSFEQAYWHQVFVPYLEDLSRKGWMGNPDVACNVHVKFGALRDYVDQRYGADTWLATGHYARLWRRDSPELEELLEASEDDLDWLWSWGKPLSRPHGGDTADADLPLLVAAVDETKDQSYFLSACTSQQLSRVIFPLGDFCKSSSNGRVSNTPTVRALAQEWELPVAHKRDSVGICFVGKRKGGFRSFLRHYYDSDDDTYGGASLVDIETGQVMGHVDALTAQAATVGQGAKVSGSAVKYFVVGRSEDRATVWICPGTHHAALYADTIVLAPDLSWVMPQLPAPLQERHGALRVQCRIRHLQPLVAATLHHTDHAHVYQVRLEQPLRGITPGQRAVFYTEGGVCLGGATMARAGPSYYDCQLPLPAALHPAGANDASVTGHSC
jgi:tRNA U34 2-thiouridine synthase MnmA/TrmU